MLAERGLTGESLVLEITETAIIKDLARTPSRFSRACAHSVCGSSWTTSAAATRRSRRSTTCRSTASRSTAPWSTTADAGGQRLLAATIDIGSRLGLKVVAEGIEDQATLDLVRQLGADTAQGFHLARPMPADALRLLLGLDASVTPQPQGT